MYILRTLWLAFIDGIRRIGDFFTNFFPRFA